MSDPLEELTVIPLPGNGRIKGENFRKLMSKAKV
jgi:hypothetical protein